MKVVINSCFGGFHLSEKALDFMGITDEEERYDFEFCWECDRRSDPRLIAVVEALGEEAANDGTYTHLKIVEIPDDIDWYISEYDGWESVEECHRSWH